MNTRALTLTLVASVAAGACGSLDDPERGEVVTITGAIEAASGVAVDEEVRVAFLWFSQRLSNQDGARYTVAQEARVAPQFPASFTLTLAALPPEAAMVDGGESLLGALDSAADGRRFALGAVVAYVDTNGNGKLDLLPVDATSSIDRVVATSERATVVYLEGESVSLSFLDGEVAPGFNYVVSACPIVENVTCGLNAQVTDISEPLVLTLDDSPQLAGLLCETVAPAEVDVTMVDGEGPPPWVSAPVEPPTREEGWVDCDPDGAVFRERCEEVPSTSLCASVGQRCVHERWAVPDDDAARLDWPCLIPGWCDDSSASNTCATPGIERVASIDGNIGSFAQDDAHLYLTTSPHGAPLEPWTLLRVPKVGGEPDALHATAAGWGMAAMGGGAGRVRWTESRFESRALPGAEGGTYLAPVETRACDAAADDPTTPRCVTLPTAQVWRVDGGGAWFVAGEDGGDPVQGPVRLVRRPLDGGADALIAQSGGFFGLVIRDDEVVWLDRADETVRAAARDGSAATVLLALSDVGLAGHLLVHADGAGLVLADVSTIRESGEPIFTLYHLPRAGGDPTELGVAPWLSPFLAFADDGVYWSVGTETVRRAPFNGAGIETAARLGAGAGWGSSPSVIAIDDARFYWVSTTGGSLWSAPRTPAVPPPPTGAPR